MRGGQAAVAPRHGCAHIRRALDVISLGNVVAVIKRSTYFGSSDAVCCSLDTLPRAPDKRAPPGRVRSPTPSAPDKPGTTPAYSLPSSWTHSAMRHTGPGCRPAIHNTEHRVFLATLPASLRPTHLIPPRLPGAQVARPFHVHQYAHDA